MIKHLTCAIVLLSATGCENALLTVQEQRYYKDRDAYAACVKATGAAGCQGERAVMDASARVASAKGVPAMQTVVVPVVR